MKKSFGKLIGTVLLPCMMISLLAGCGTKNTGNTSKTSGNAETNGTEISETEATYMIGGIGPLSGEAAIYGQAVKNAAEMAVKEINEAGGVNGYQISFKMEDDEHDPEKAVNAYNSLKDWGMKLLMGTVTSGPCTAVVAKSSADNMFQLTPSATAVDSIAFDNAFRVCFSDPNQGSASAVYIGTKGLAKKVAVIYDSSEIYSSGIYETFVAEAANQPFEIVAEEAFTAESSKDFTVQLQKAKDAGAELVFLPIYYQAASLILKQADTMGYDPLFFGCDGLDGLLSVENFDTTLAEGVMLLTPFVANAQDNATTKFVEAYKNTYGDTPNQFAADAYDAIYIMKAALEKSGVAPDASVSDICEAMKTAMTQISYEGVTGSITWTADGEPTKNPNAMVIVDGVYKSME